MKKLLVLGIAISALTAAVTAQAAPGLSLRGDTGVARTPMAVALPPLTLAIAADHVASNDVFIPMRVEFGVIEGLEVGANYWYLNNEGGSTIWGLNAKYVFPEFVQNLGLAVGGHYRKQTLGDLKNDGHDIYLVASYPVGFLVPTLGVVYESITGANDESDARFFGSIVANVLPTFALGAEIQSASNKLDGTGADPVMWFGARFVPMENFTVQAGLINYADFGAAADKMKNFIFHVGVQYAFSFKK
jgi:hypothetical protein